MGKPLGSKPPAAPSTVRSGVNLCACAAVKFGILPDPCFRPFRGPLTAPGTPQPALRLCWAPGTPSSMARLVRRKGVWVLGVEWLGVFEELAGPDVGRWRSGESSQVSVELTKVPDWLSVGESLKSGARRLGIEEVSLME
jgi:hypothetical protein